MINQTVLTGRLTRDAEVRETSNGLKVGNFSLAVNQGAETTYFFNCVVFDKLSDVAKKFLKKGMLIGVTGRLTTRDYTKKDGSKAVATEIVVDKIDFLEKKSNEQ